MVRLILQLIGIILTLVIAIPLFIFNLLVGFFNGKKKRAYVMNSTIINLISSGRSEAVLNHIYYEAAHKFALESGAEPRLFDSQSGLFFMKVRNTEYQIYISRWKNGSTYISVTNAEKAKNDFADLLKSRNADNKTYPPSTISALLVGIKKGILDSSEMVNLLEKFKNDAAELKQAIRNILLLSLNEGSYDRNIIVKSHELSTIVDNVADDVYSELIEKYALYEENKKLDYLDSLTDEEYNEWYRNQDSANDELPFPDVESDDAPILNKNERYHREVAETITKLFTLIQDKDVQEELHMNHLTGLPLSVGAASVHFLMRKISTLTGKTQQELFDNNFAGLLKIMEDTPKDILQSKSQDAQSLVDIVKKTNDLPEGVFANINNDLNEHIRQDHSPMVSMAYAYARRTVSAGLFLQGGFSRADYIQASKVFKAMQLKTGHTVEFQEEARDQAEELLCSYDKRLNRRMTSLMTTMVEHNQTPELYNGKTHLPYELIITNLQNALDTNTCHNTKAEISKLFKQLHTLLGQDEEVENNFYDYYLSGYNIKLPTEIKDIMDKLSDLTGKSPERVFRDNFDGTKKPVDDCSYAENCDYQDDPKCEEILQELNALMRDTGALQELYAYYHNRLPIPADCDIGNAHLLLTDLSTLTSKNNKELLKEVIDKSYKIDCQYYSNGVIKTETPYSNGAINGLVREYYKNGNLKYTIPYKNNRAEGIAIKYYDTGELAAKTPYHSYSDSEFCINGVEKRYYISGELEAEVPYSDNMVEGTHVAYYKSGRIKFEAEHYCGFPRGKFIIYEDIDDAIGRNGSELSEEEIHSLFPELC